MRDEIQLQKPNSNIFCYCYFTARLGKIVVVCDIQEYNPESEENEGVSKKELTLREFADMVEKEKWIVC